VFPNGPTLNATTGINPPFLVLPAYKSYQNRQDAILINAVLDSDGYLNDPTPGNEVQEPGTLLTMTQWTNFAVGIGTSNQKPAEIIAEASSMRRLIGNIWERRTRFVQLI